MVPTHSLPSPGNAHGPQNPHHYQYVDTPPSPKSRKSFNPKYMPPLDYRYKPLFKRDGDDPFKYDVSSPTPAQSPYDERNDRRYEERNERRSQFDDRKTSAPCVPTGGILGHTVTGHSVTGGTLGQSVTPHSVTGGALGHTLGTLGALGTLGNLGSGHSHYTTEPLPRKRGYSAPQNKVHQLQQYSSSSRATIKKARRAYRSKFTQEQDRLIISMKNENKTWQEIKEMVKGETPHNIQRRYEVLMAQMNGNLIWEQDDLDALVDLLEAAERHKWKHISSELSRKLDKKVTPLACQKKFKEMFGVAENSSLLGSSLCYAYYDNGWQCVE